MNDEQLIWESYQNLLNEELKLFRMNNSEGRVIFLIKAVDSEGKELPQETFRKKPDIARTGLFKWDGILKKWISKESFTQEEYQQQVRKYQEATIRANTGGRNPTPESLASLKDELEELVDQPQPITEKLVQFIEDLKNKLRDVKDSPEMKSFLEFRSKFRKYSLYNSILIFIQKPNATHIASASKWKREFNRIVKAGEKGIQIFAPITVKDRTKEKEEPTKENQPNPEVAPTLKQKEQYLVTRFKLVSVFDISQTKPIEGKEEIQIPDENIWFNNAPYDEKNDVIFDALMEFCKEKNIKVNIVNDLNGARGVSKLGAIDLVSKDISTFVHEIAHELIHSYEVRTRNTIDKKTRELQAEGVAYLVSSEFGMETKYNINYMYLWKSDPDNVEQNEKILRDIAKQIIEYIYNFYSKEETDQSEQENLNDSVIYNLMKRFLLNG